MVCYVNPKQNNYRLSTILLIHVYGKEIAMKFAGN
jgi:hypothetical protein